jgi:hypothetical protein
MKRWKIKCDNTQYITTQRKAQLQRIKDEIRYLYKKKQHLNTELYHAHLKTAQEWNGTMHLISNHIHTIANRQATTKYKTIHKKLDALTTQQTNSLTTNVKFYPRVVNNTNIVLSNDEMSLLNKGLKYNLHFKCRNWLYTLAFEADAIITYLPTSKQEGMRYLVAQEIQQLYRRQTREHTCNTLHAKHEQHILNSISLNLKTIKP